MVGGWRMPTGKFNTHYLAARQGERKKVTTKKKTYIQYSRQSFVCR